MQNTFDAWEGEHLEHYGIPGMRWGVRRFQNEDGSLTSKGEKRYGVSGTGGSARSMQRHFNKLDAGYANVAAEKNAAMNRVNKYANKALRYSAKKGLMTPEAMAANKKMGKYKNKMRKAAKVAKLSDDRMKAIESLQLRILGKAMEKGYTTKSKAVTRIGNTNKQRALATLNALFGVGGAVGGALTGALLTTSGTKVQGQKVKIRKKGDGSTSVVNYAQANRAERERQKKQQGR